MNAEELKYVIKAGIDNTSNSPGKPSDFKAYQKGFADCYSQVLELIDKKEAWDKAHSDNR